MRSKAVILVVGLSLSSGLFATSASAQRGGDRATPAQTTPRAEGRGFMNGFRQMVRGIRSAFSRNRQGTQASVAPIPARTHGLATEHAVGPVQRSAPPRIDSLVRTLSERRAPPRERRPFAIRSTPAGERGPLVVFLHGAGQQPDNQVLRHLVNGLGAEGVGASFVSLPHETDHRSLDRLLARTTRPVILAGHSAGGAKALDYGAAPEHRGKIRAVIAVNPAGGPLSMPVPTLVLSGTNDYSPIRPEEAGRNVKVVSVQGSDHSLRFRATNDPRPKDFHDASQETTEMNRGVARNIRDFFGALESR